MGTYSSIFIASPVLLGWTNVAKRRKAKKSGLNTEAPVVEESVNEEDTVSLQKATEIPDAMRKRKGKRKNKK